MGVAIQKTIGQIKAERKAKLAALIEEYKKVLRSVPKSKVSEETVRTWINDFLSVFGWDVRNVNQVWQEAVLDGWERSRLASINSTHKRPDYTLLRGADIKTFLDAKSLSIDIFTNKAAAFQIRSYGWSAQVPCAFVSNFAQLAIFDTRNRPDETQDAAHGVVQIGVDEYLSKFDLIFDHLWRGNVIENGLRRLYELSPKNGTKTLDAQFMGVLSEFRYKLAVELQRKNAAIVADDIAINYYVQVIMDRIIFIRVCEAKGIERKERLREFQHSANGFWRSFRESCYMEFYRHYDGAMFERDEKFKSIELRDDVFAEFLDELYYPSPYRFDVIPIMMLARIYEEFLGKRLTLSKGKVKEELKGEYVRTNGAIPTPEHIVRAVCRETLPIGAKRTLNELLQSPILDPCCGSGVFLVACYDFLEKQFIDILKNDDELQRLYQDYYFVDEDGNWLLTLEGRRLLIVRCLHGIDIDEAAVEVTKMSLALKIVDGTCITVWNSLGANGKRILRDIAANVQLGNALVPLSKGVTEKQAKALSAFNPSEAFPEVFGGRSPGFAYIVCNPPYVETKYYKEAQPTLHRYLSQKYAAFEGKADLAVLFIERCLELLSEKGKAGFIVQRRWFKTDYGRGIRAVINARRSLDTMIEFSATDIFPGKTTYVAVMTMTKTAHNQIRYRFVKGNGEEVRQLCDAMNGCDHSLCSTGSRRLPHPRDNAPWDFDDSGIGTLYDRMEEAHGCLKNFPGLEIKDGIQALWKKIYHIRDVSFSRGIATGCNGFGEIVKVEKEILRGVVYNREFYPFMNVEPDAWCIFPYEGASADAISYSDMKKRYPLAYEYLKENKGRIRGEVKCRDGEKWHTFTREHNHGLYNVNKIIVPMTAKDTMATYVGGKNGLYMDNANVWFVKVDGADERLMKAVSAVLNSTTFSVLAKQKANPQSGGYYKFNKQFLDPVPFPTTRLLESRTIQRELADMCDKIHVLEELWISENSNRRQLVKQRLDNLWSELDRAVDRLYGLSSGDAKRVHDIGRTVSRIELLPEG